MNFTETVPENPPQLGVLLNTCPMTRGSVHSTKRLLSFHVHLLISVSRRILIIIIFVHLYLHLKRCHCDDNHTMIHLFDDNNPTNKATLNYNLLFLRCWCDSNRLISIILYRISKSDRRRCVFPRRSQINEVRDQIQHLTFHNQLNNTTPEPQTTRKRWSARLIHPKQARTRGARLSGGAHQNQF